MVGPRRGGLAGPRPTRRYAVHLRRPLADRGFRSARFLFPAEETGVLQHAGMPAPFFEGLLPEGAQRDAVASVLGVFAREYVWIAGGTGGGGGRGTLALARRADASSAQRGGTARDPVGPGAPSGARHHPNPTLSGRAPGQPAPFTGGRPIQDAGHRHRWRRGAPVSGAAQHPYPEAIHRALPRDRGKRGVSPCVSLHAWDYRWHPSSPA